MCRLISHKDDSNVLENMKHYLKDTDYNEVLYYNRSENTESKIDTVLKDAAILIKSCSDNYDDSSEYQLLIRVINEQTKTDESGILKLKEKFS
jgi:hypothetical protein